MKVPFCDLYVQHAPLMEEFERAFRRVLDRSTFILGEEVRAFERAFGEYIGADHAIGTSSGSTALLEALKALGVAAGDEVIVPAMTFYATAEAMAFLGAVPVFVDVDPLTFTLDPGAVQRAITERTKVILPVHLHGGPADLDGLNRVARAYGLRVLADCAHAHGATYGGRRVGSIEDVAAFSFYPSKNLGALGEAGMITTGDPELAARCRHYRDHGSTSKYAHRVIGLNARMSAIQAAVLGVKLPKLDGWNEERRRIARRYQGALAALPLVTPYQADHTRHVFHVYQIRLQERDVLAEALRGEDIETVIHYPVPMHLHEGFSYRRHRRGDFPIAERFADTSVSIPCYPGMTGEQQAHVIGAIQRFFERRPGAHEGHPNAVMSTSGDAFD